MSYTEKHLDQIDAELSRPGRNGDPPKLTPALSSDPELKEAAHDVELLWQATRLERLQGKLEMLKEYALRQAQGQDLRQAQGPEAKAEAEAKENKKVKVISMHKVRFLLSVAAGVLLMVAVGWFVTSDRGTDKSYMAYLNQPLLNVITERGKDVETYLSTAMTQFDLGNYALAVKEFEKSNLSRDDNAQVYFGYSLVATGKYRKGIDVLKVYLDQPVKTDNAESKYCRAYGKYVLSLAYLITSQKTDEAKEELIRLSEEANGITIPAELIDQLKK